MGEATDKGSFKDGVGLSNGALFTGRCPMFQERNRHMQQAERVAATGRAARKRENTARRRESVGRKPYGEERKRVETVVETLATLRSPGETLPEVAHDARNMVTALGLYCDLLEEPGVLAVPFLHYGHELRLVAAASRRLVEKIVALDAEGTARIAATDTDYPLESRRWMRSAPEAGPNPGAGTAIGLGFEKGTGTGAAVNRRWDLLPAILVNNLAADLLASRNLLAALAGPAIALTAVADGGASPVKLTGEDLTRILVNLVKNATEAMPSGGRIHIGLREQAASQGTAACLLLFVEDNGPGIPEESLERIFVSGYTTRGMSGGSSGNWTLRHRGLGLTIVRSIVEDAGGRITARNREQGGARFEIELPVRRSGF